LRKGVAMPDYDIGFKIAARASGRRLSELGGVHCQEWEPLGGEVHATERLADRAFRARSGHEHFVVYVEAYTRWTKEAPWSVLAKSAMLAERERLPVRSLVYVLLRRGYHQQRGTLRLKLADGPAQQVWFRPICLWRQQPQPWWEEAPGLMALYPLCRHERPRRQAIEYAAAVIQAGTSDSVQRANLLTTLGIFGRLVYPDLPVLDLIGRQLMKESPAYQEIMDEGRIESLRTAIQTALEIRFGASAAAEFAPALGGITDLDRLTELHRLAISCRRVSEFRRVLAPGDSR
jgi:hypothetical protein